MDKSNLQKRVAELDDMVKRLFSMQESKRPNTQQQMSSSSMRLIDYDLGERLSHSKQVLSGINNQLAQYRRHDDKAERQGDGTKLRGEFS